MPKRKKRRYWEARKRNALWKLNPHCHYCDVLTIRPEDLRKQGINRVPDNMATLDHVHTRHDKERYLPGGNSQVVLACNKCNNDRGSERDKLVPLPERQEKSGSKPLLDFLSKEQQLEIINTVFNNRSFEKRQDLYFFLARYLNTEEFRSMKDKYQVKTKYIVGTIYTHFNSKQLNKG